jgi:hypothetical protein
MPGHGRGDRSGAPVPGPADRSYPEPEELGIQFAEYTLAAEFRRPLAGRLILLLPVAAVTLTVGYLDGHAVMTLVFGWLVAPFAAVNLILYFWRGRFLTRVTSEGILVRGYFSRFVPWREVGHLEIHGLQAPMRLGANFRPSYLGYFLGEGAPERVVCDSSPWGQRSRLATITVVRTNGAKVLLRAPLVTDWAPDHLFAEKAAELSTLSRWHTGAPL